MTIKELVTAIAKKNEAYGFQLNRPAPTADILAFEKVIGFSLPADFVAFYHTCNGFGCIEDIFNMLSLSEIVEDAHTHGSNWFYFAEYMIYSDTWGLRLTASGVYEVFNSTYPSTPLTSSLAEFLDRFRRGNIFDSDGLYCWQEELNSASQ